MQNQQLLADAYGADGEGGGVGAIEDVAHRHVGVFALCRFDQRAPPTTAGVERGTWRGEKSHGAADGEHGASVGEAVDNDGGLAINTHCSLLYA